MNDEQERTSQQFGQQEDQVNQAGQTGPTQNTNEGGSSDSDFFGSDDSNQSNQPNQQTAPGGGQQTTARQTVDHPVGIDIGTENLIVAREQEGGVRIGSQRNAFIEVPNDDFTRNMISQRKISHAEQDGKLYILGNAAFELSQIFNRDPQRPMDRGVLSPEETDAIPIISMVLEKMIGRSDNNDTAVYSIPADPIDTDFDAKFHEGIFDEILSDLGYESRSIYEGHSVALTELKDSDFTGVACSFGAGMTNTCISYQSIPAVVMSTSRGGRWIDSKASQVSGRTQSRVTAIKERGMDVMNPQDRVQKAISIYYRELLTWTLENMARKFKEENDVPSFTNPVPLVAAGGTSKIEGFEPLLKEVFMDVGFPLEISDIRVANEPLNSVSRGCLVSAQTGQGS